MAQDTLYVIDQQYVGYCVINQNQQELIIIDTAGYYVALKGEPALNRSALKFKYEAKKQHIKLKTGLLSNIKLHVQAGNRLEAQYYLNKYRWLAAENEVMAKVNREIGDQNRDFKRLKYQLRNEFMLQENSKTLLNKKFHKWIRKYATELFAKSEEIVRYNQLIVDSIRNVQIGTNPKQVRGLLNRLYNGSVDYIIFKAMLDMQHANFKTVVTNDKQYVDKCWFLMENFSNPAHIKKLYCTRKLNWLSWFKRRKLKQKHKLETGDRLKC